MCYIRNHLPVRRSNRACKNMIGLLRDIQSYSIVLVACERRYAYVRVRIFSKCLYKLFHTFEHGSKVCSLDACNMKINVK
jgi:hypothetical protein